MRPCDVYAKELSSLFRGHAVHNPRRAKLQSSLGLRPPISVGDVAYDFDGQIIRLFNCLLPPDLQDADSTLPNNFEVLEASQRTGNAPRSVPVAVLESHNRPGPFYSKGVRMLEVEAAVSVPPASGARVAFSTRHEQGAVLLTSHRITSRKSPHRPLFEKYMIKHYDSWCDLLESLGLDVRPEELILITAVEATQAWSNVVFSNRQLRGDFSVDIPSICAVGGRLSGGVEFSRTQSATRDSGPNPEDLVIGEGSDANHVSPSTLQDDQVIFVRALRAKKRKFTGLKVIKAGADPENSDDNSDNDGGDSDMSLESVDGLQPRVEDYLTPVLDFILKKTGADIAVVHDDDYAVFCKHMHVPLAGEELVRLQSEAGLTYGIFTGPLPGRLAEDVFGQTSPELAEQQLGVYENNQSFLHAEDYYVATPLISPPYAISVVAPRTEDAHRSTTLRHSEMSAPIMTPSSEYSGDSEYGSPYAEGIDVQFAVETGSPPSESHTRAATEDASRKHSNARSKGSKKEGFLACYFCRGRKIACSPPPKDAEDRTCEQCLKRKLPCEYPTISRRGQRNLDGKKGSQEQYVPRRAHTDDHKPFQEGSSLMYGHGDYIASGKVNIDRGGKKATMDVREQYTEGTPNTPPSGDVKPHSTGTGTGSRSLESSSKDWECYLSKDDRLVSSQACGKPPSRSRTEIEILGVIDDGSAYTTSRPIAETKSWYLHADYEEGKDIVIDTDGIVRGGTVSALVGYLTTHEFTDTSFTASFLATFKSFTDIDTLVGLLIERFWIKSPDGLSKEEREEWETMKQRIIRTRVLVVLETIILDDDVLEEKDMHVVDRLTEFVRPDEVQSQEAGRHLLAQIERTDRGSARKTTISCDSQPPPIVPRPKGKPKLLEFDPLEVARQLTNIECALFLKIKAGEYLTWGSESASGPSEDIRAAIQTSNKIAHWVADAVLEKNGAHERGLLVKYFITVADRCRDLRNISSMVAIVSGLNAPPVRRLKRTWDEINQRSVKMLSACEVTIDSGKNFSNYRQLLQSITPPCVPFIGVYLTTLTAIQNNEPNTISGNLVNFRKCAKVAEVIQEIKKWQSKPFNFARVEPIADYLHDQLNKFNGVPNVSDVFWNRSLEREPREHVDEQMAILLQETGLLQGLPRASSSVP